MSETELGKSVENLFTNARLYGWCDQVDQGIEQLPRAGDEERGTALRGLLENILARPELDKEQAVLSLILLHRLAIPYSDLFIPVFRHLSRKLHANDFRFLVRYFFDNRVPLPRDLAYDITERLFFSLESVYDKVVRDFSRVPFHNADPIIFYLLLHNSRVDLNTQNKELMCIVLTHIEVELPDPIIEDVVAYLDANAALEESWIARRKTIEFDHRSPEEAVAGPAAPSLDDEAGRPPSKPEPAGRPSVELERPDITVRPLSEGEGSVEEPDRPAAPRPTEAQRGQILPPGHRRFEGEEAGKPARATPPPPGKRDRFVFPGFSNGKSRTTAAPQTAPTDETAPAAPAKQAPIIDPNSGRRDAGAYGGGGSTSPEPAAARLEYEEFMAEGAGRGIRLAKLGKGRGRKEPPVNQTIQPKRPGRTIPWWVWLACLLALVLALVWLFSSSRAVVQTHPAQPAGPPQLQSSPAVAATEKNSITVRAGPAGPVFFLEGKRLGWEVRSGDTLYSLFLALRSPMQGLPDEERLRILGDGSWHTFLSHIRGLNGGRDDLSLIFPRDQLIILEY